jgi:tetratricopeptide (TPR) repeat protein
LAYLIFVAVMPASAQPAGTQAEELYDRGRALIAAGKTAEACAAFEQSQQLEPAATTLLALATCDERLGKLATAWKLFLEAEAQTRSASDEKSGQLHKIALERAAKLESRVSKLTIRVPDASKVDGLEILRDQERIPAEEWNRALPLDGGTFTITARAPGKSDWSMGVTISSEADAKTVDIPDLQETPGSGGSQSAIPLGLSDRPARRSGVLPIAVGAGAVVLLGGALGLSLWGDATYDDAKAEMMDQGRRDALATSADRKRYAAEGLVIAGAGCAGVAVWLYFRQRGARSEPAPARAGQVMIAPTASGIGVVGRF